MAKFDIKLTPESQKLVNELAKTGKIDLRPTMLPIGLGYLKEVKGIFEKKQARGVGDRWAPLSDNPPGKGYATWKQKHFPGRPLLVRTGALKDSMTRKGAPGNIFAISKTTGVFGTSIPYGIYHDSDKLPRTRLPRRNFSEPSEGRYKIWEDQITKAIIHNFEVNGVKVQGSVLK